MIELPDFKKTFDYENDFYLSCDITRISKFLTHYELFKMVQNVPGAIVECGIFKGASFARWSMFRELLLNSFSKKLIGFDIFGTFPETNFEADKKIVEDWKSNAGDQSISQSQLMDVLKYKGTNKNVELVEGDILKTVPEYLDAHPELIISLLNLDTDIYEPAVTILDNFYPRIVPGGILVLDDYGVFPGETKAVEDYFKDKKVKIEKLPFCMTPCYVVKK